MESKGVCIIKDCINSVKARNWCDRHLQRYYRNGDPNIKSLSVPFTKFATLKECLEDGVIAMTPGHCWEWQKSKNKQGYGGVWWRGKHLRAHRASYQVFKGDTPVGFYVCHKCDNYSCVNPEHLFIGTATDNNTDRKNKGRNANIKGEKNPFHKLKEPQVNEIISLLKTNMTQKDIAKKFNVSSYCIYGIKKKKTWRHLTEERGCR